MGKEGADKQAFLVMGITHESELRWRYDKEEKHQRRGRGRGVERYRERLGAGSV